jgi:hypothetical protein
MMSLRAVNKKQAESVAVPPKKTSIPARIFIYKSNFLPANPNLVENYVYDTQVKLIADGYAIVDRSSTGNATMFMLTPSAVVSSPQHTVLIDNGYGPVLLLIEKFTEYEQFMRSYGLLTPFIERYLPGLPEQQVAMRLIIEPPAPPKYW